MLVPPVSPVSCCLGVAAWGQDANIAEIGRLGQPARVGFRGDLVKRSIVLPALISPLVPCIEVSLAVRSAAYCSLRRWSGDGAENSKKCKVGQRGTNRKFHNFG